MWKIFLIACFSHDYLCRSVTNRIDATPEIAFANFRCAIPALRFGMESIMTEQLLQIKNLCVAVEQKEILHDISLNIKKGETHVLMGPNGAGKSTLGYALMGNPGYRITAGQILFGGEDITQKSPDKRARDGIFLSFQNPPEVPGISLGNFIRNAMEQRTGKRIRPWEFRKELKKTMDVLQMDESYADRDLNVGFSGGEKKKAEMLQLLMLHPALAILDETDSGLDVDAVRTVSEGIQAFQKNQNRSLLIITHSTKMLELLCVDAAHVMADGKLAVSGGRTLIDEVHADGFERYARQAQGRPKREVL